MELARIRQLRIGTRIYGTGLDSFKSEREFMEHDQIASNQGSSIYGSWNQLDQVNRQLQIRERVLMELAGSSKQIALNQGTAIYRTRYIDSFKSGSEYL